MIPERGIGRAHRADRDAGRKTDLFGRQVTCDRDTLLPFRIMRRAASSQSLPARADLSPRRQAIAFEDPGDLLQLLTPARPAK